MCNVLKVAVVNALHNLLEHFGSISFIKELFFNDLIEQFSALADLSDEVNILGVLKVLIELDDMWVINLLQNLDFGLESLPVLDFVSRNGFASSGMTSGQMCDLVDSPIRTASKRLAIDFVDISDSLRILNYHRLFSY